MKREKKNHKEHRIKKKKGRRDSGGRAEEMRMGIIIIKSFFHIYIFLKV